MKYGLSRLHIYFISRSSMINYQCQRSLEVRLLWLSSWLCYLLWEPCLLYLWLIHAATSSWLPRFPSVTIAFIIVGHSCSWLRDMSYHRAIQRCWDSYYKLILWPWWMCVLWTPPSPSEVDEHEKKIHSNKISESLWVPPTIVHQGSSCISP